MKFIHLSVQPRFFGIFTEFFSNPHQLILECFHQKETLYPLAVTTHSSPMSNPGKPQIPFLPLKMFPTAGISHQRDHTAWLTPPSGMKCFDSHRVFHSIVSHCSVQNLLEAKVQKHRITFLRGRG